MNELAKWAWLILLPILAFGWWAVAFYGIIAIAYVVIIITKPKWIDKL